MRPLIFLLAWAFLDCLFNVRFPGDEPTFWYPLPSIDVVVLLAVFWFVRSRGHVVPDGLRFALVVISIAVRIFRCAEGIVERHFHRPLSLYLDVPLLPNLLGLMRSTVSLPRLLGWTSLIAMAIVVVGAFTWWALAASERALATRGPRRLFVAGLIVCMVLSPLWSQRRDPQVHIGLFGRSIVPRLARELSFLRHAQDYRREKTEGIARMRERLRAIRRTAFRSTSSAAIDHSFDASSLPVTRPACAPAASIPLRRWRRSCPSCWRCSPVPALALREPRGRRSAVASS